MCVYIYDKEPDDYKPIAWFCFNRMWMYSKTNHLACDFYVWQSSRPWDRWDDYFYRVHILALGIRKQRNIQIEDRDNFKQK